MPNPLKSALAAAFAAALFNLGARAGEEPAKDCAGEAAKCASQCKGCKCPKAEGAKDAAISVDVRQDAPKDPARQDAPKDVVDQGDVKAPAKQDTPKGVVDQGDVKAPAKQDAPKGVVDQGNVRTPAKQDHPRSGY